MCVSVYFLQPGIKLVYLDSACVCVCVCVCVCECVWAKSEYFISFTLVLAQKKLLKKDTYKDNKQSFQNIVKQ